LPVRPGKIRPWSSHRTPNLNRSSFCAATNGEGDRVSFMILRTLFAIGWVLLGYVLWSDRRAVVGRPSPSLR
jgi:hypothetical protein